MLQVRLGYHHAQSQRIYAHVDSGSPYCLFPFDLATLVGLDPLRSPVFTDNIGGIIKGVKDTVYFHRVKLFVESDWKIEVTAGFIKKLNASGILGRLGFFDHFKITFDHERHPPAFEIEKLERPI
jgi:hypothetical protein